MKLVAAFEGFDVTCIAIEEGMAVRFVLENQDEQLHNFSVYLEEPKLPEDQAAPDLQFRSEDARPMSALSFEFPPLEPGNYFFRCDSHPAVMTGTVEVVGRA